MCEETFFLIRFLKILNLRVSFTQIPSLLALKPSLQIQPDIHPRGHIEPIGQGKQLVKISLGPSHFSKSNY